jgi:hypothetical protein
MDYKIVVDIGVNPPILLLNNEVCHTHLDSDTRQMFETKEGSFIYFKDEQKLHKIDTDVYTKALLKVINHLDIISNGQY